MLTVGLTVKQVAIAIARVASFSAVIISANPVIE